MLDGAAGGAGAGLTDAYPTRPFFGTRRMTAGLGAGIVMHHASDPGLSSGPGSRAAPATPGVRRRPPVEANVVGPQVPQRLLELRDQRLAAATAAVGVAGEQIAEELRAQHDALA